MKNYLQNIMNATRISKVIVNNSTSNIISEDYFPIADNLTLNSSFSVDENFFDSLSANPREEELNANSSVSESSSLSNSFSSLRSEEESFFPPHQIPHDFTIDNSYFNSTDRDEPRNQPHSVEENILINNQNNRSDHPIMPFSSQPSSLVENYFPSPQPETTPGYKEKLLKFYKEHNTLVDKSAVALTILAGSCFYGARSLASTTALGGMYLYMGGINKEKSFTTALGIGALYFGGNYVTPLVPGLLGSLASGISLFLATLPLITQSIENFKDEFPNKFSEIVKYEKKITKVGDIARNWGGNQVIWAIGKFAGCSSHVPFMQDLLVDSGKKAVNGLCYILNKVGTFAPQLVGKTIINGACFLARKTKEVDPELVGRNVYNYGTSYATNLASQLSRRSNRTSSTQAQRNSNNNESFVERVTSDTVRNLAASL